MSHGFLGIRGHDLDALSGARSHPVAADEQLVWTHLFDSFHNDHTGQYQLLAIMG
jgi:hypothetical protein